MRKFLFGFLLLAMTSFSASAVPGDTTWVQAHAGTELSWFGDYDTTISFPAGNTSYRKIYMVFTLGKYICPPNEQYCSDWDYTVQTKLMTPGGDTVELGRLITPYANSMRMTANWKGVYQFDVTDFYPLLQNSNTVRVHYSGYSGGFTADVKFAFIEGTPERDVVGIKPLWKGGFNYGHGSTPINDALANVSLTAPANAQTAELKFTVTGHGGDAQGCAEFCPNTYTVNLNNSALATQNFWRDDCGFNNYYPQNGTWIYDRGGWCPGDLVKPFSHVLTGVNGGSNYTVNATFPNYTSVPNPNSQSQASYIIEAAVFYYGGMNKALDASLDDIINPTIFEAHFRENPSAGGPVIKVKNTGSTTVTSLKIQYGVPGQWMPEYTWNGSLGALEETEIALPEVWSVRAAVDTNTFVATILEVNGQTDEDATNNSLSSKFVGVPSWPSKVVVSMKTNNGVVGGASENNWVILNIGGDTVASRLNNNPATQYSDTVVLGPGVYKLVVEDRGCDGMNWWANPGAGVGNFRIMRTTSVFPLTLNGYYGGDFGCGFSQWFSTAWPTGVQELTAGGTKLEAYPNPAGEEVSVRISGLKEAGGMLSVVDAMGRVVYSTEVDQELLRIDSRGLGNGVYMILYSEAGRGRLQTRIVVAH